MDVDSGKQLPLLPSGYAFRFSDFVAGPNLEALDAVTKIATTPHRGDVIYVWGASGSGKTHLLQAACAEAGEASMQSVYLPLGEIANGLHAGVCEGLERLELVAIDDVHTSAGDADWEHALFSLFNRIRDFGGRLLLSADCAPQQLPMDLPDLNSRLAWGVALQLCELTDEQKIQAMQKHASARGFELPEGVAQYLIGRTPRNLGSLCKLIEQLDVASLAEQRKLTVPFVKSVFEL